MTPNTYSFLIAFLYLSILSGELEQVKVLCPSPPISHEYQELAGPLSTTNLQVVQCGDDIGASLSENLEVDSFSITLLADDLLLIHLKDPTWDQLRLELLDPAGVVLQSATTQNEGFLSLKQTMPIDGEFLIKVSSISGGATRDYGISFQLSNSVTCAQAVSCGEDIDATISENAEIDAYAIPLNAGDSLLVQIKDRFSNDLVLELYSPTGHQLAAIQANTENFGQLPFQITQTGTYLLLAYGLNGGTSIGYGISFQLTNDATCAQAVSCGEDIDATISENAEIDAYAIPLNAGDSLLVQIKDRFSNDLVLELYSPTGHQLAAIQTNTENFGQLPFQITQTGTYLLLAYGLNGGTSIGYGISFQLTNDATCAQAVSCGEDIDATISENAEIDAYAIPLNAGDSLLVQIKDRFSNNLVLEFYSPTGHQLAAIQTNTENFGQLPFQVTQTGTYLLLAYGLNGGTSIGYGISFQLTNDAICAQAVSCGEDIGATISENAEIDAYAIPLNAGDSLLVQIKDRFSNDLVLELYSPAGHQLAAIQTNAESFGQLRFQITQTGTYLLLAYGLNGGTSIGYGISFQLTNSIACAQPVNCGDDVDATIGKDGEIDAYAIELNVGDSLLVQIKDGLSNDLELELYDPTGVLLATTQTDTENFGRLRFQIPETGNYLVLVYGLNGGTSVSYGISFQLTNSSACAQLVNCGDDLAAAISEDGEIDAYAIELNVGDSLLVQIKDGLSNDLVLELYDPTGILLATTQTDLQNFGQLRFQIPETGNYLVLVYGFNGGTTVSYGISVQLLNNVSCGKPVSCQENLLESISTLTQINAYTLPLSQGDQLHIQLKDFGTDRNILRMYHPSGRLLTSATANSKGLVQFNFAIEDPGNYLILASGLNGIASGTYGISFQVLNNVSCAQMVSCDTDLTASIGLLAEIQQYVLSLNVGDILRVGAKDNGADPLRIEAFNAQGATVISDTANLSGFLEIDYTVEESGLYFFKVDGLDGEDTGTFNLSFQVINDSGCAQGLPCSTSDRINKFDPGGMDVFHFEAEIGDLLFLELNQEALSFEPNIQVLDQLGQELLHIESKPYLLQDFSLTDVGNYFVAITDQNGLASGQYELKMAVVSEEEIGHQGIFICDGECLSVWGGCQTLPGIYPKFPDGSNQCDSLTFINLQNLDQPVANRDTAIVFTNSSIDFNVVVNDLLPLNWSLEVTEMPSRGDLTYQGDGKFTYTNTDPDFSVDDFSYRVCNGPDCQPACDDTQVLIQIFAEGEDTIRLQAYNPILTPNGDGFNDVLKFQEDLIDIRTNKLTVFNRAGNTVFRASPYNNNWNGTYNGQALPNGTYYYILELGAEDERSLNGYITLLREK